MGYGKTIIAEHAAVASEQPLASLAGYDVLRAGGNAFDAAVATSFSLAVTFHPAGGLGGDFFGMLFEAKSGKVHCLNSSGWSPSGLTHDLVMSKWGGQIPQFGPLTCSIPAFVAGVHEMHRRFGSLPFPQLLAGPIEFATRGFPAGEGICRSVAGAYPELSPEAKAVFAPGGKPPTPGDAIKQENLGKVISNIAARGPEGFYADWPADRIREALEGLGVPTEAGDFRDYRPEWVAPLSLDYRGTKVYEVPPNSMGATSLLILKLLSEHDMSRTGALSRERIDLTMKAVLTAYRRRDELLGDPKFGKFDLEGFMSAGTSDGIPASRIKSGDTTAFSIVDAEGNVVSGIQSLFNHFGSRVFVPGCGVMLNNRGSGFSLSGPNVVAPRKRPLNTLSSMILERNGSPFLSIGTSGGDRRPLQHALFVTNAVDYSLAAEANVAHPRFLWGGGTDLIVEEGYELPDSGTYDLQKLPMPGRTGVCQAVEISPGHRTAVCDLRGDGVPAGF
ncbi:MAG: gamma-glutamyltransferase family protein [Thaumarchaeota archaeon]|nr:gamma-glutamyltransferase family protein [Nitrososphaerota archaeon]